MLGILGDTLTNVVSSIKSHHFAGSHDVNFLGLTFTNRHGETAAHHVAQHIVENVIKVFGIGTELFEHANRGNNATACATHARFRATGFYATHTLEAHFFEVRKLNFGFIVTNGVKHSLLMKAAEQKAGRVCFRVATDHKNVFSLFYKACGQVLSRGGLTDATLSVNSDLT